MAAAAFPVSIPDLQRTPRRFAVALAVSVVVHLVFAAFLTLEALQRGAPFPQATASITVWLDLEPLPRADAPLPQLDAESSPPAARQKRLAPATADEQHAAPVHPDALPAQPETAAPVLPQVPDPTYYSARELDSYPRPVMPFRLGHPAGVARDGAPEKVQLSLHIDEHGVVNRISIVETALPGDFEDELRAMLTATRFIPARKDGRPVKSRILLSISFASAGKNDDR